MIITEIKFESGTLVTQLMPEENYKYITNGEAYSTLVFLGADDKIENWHDTNDEPPTPDEEATIEDYENSLERLGVDID